MTVLSALTLNLAVIVSLHAQAQSTCQNPVYCPCGSTNKNITVCNEAKGRDIELCKKWSRCKSCQDGLNKCLQCEDGFDGPLCSIRVMCPDPGQVANADRLNSDGSPSVGTLQYRVGQSVVYTCHEGFALQRRSLITCLPSGAWSNGTPHCTRITPPNRVSTRSVRRRREDRSQCTRMRYCRNLGVDSNGSRQLKLPPNRRGFPQGTIIDYSCNEGYDLVGEATIFCLTSGMWSAAPPDCKAQSSGSDKSDGTELNFCPNPGSISDGQVVYYPSVDSLTDTQQDNSDPEYPEGSGLRYSCNTGYSLEGEAFLICESSGFWTAEKPACRRDRSSNTMFCDNPGRILNGIITVISPELEQRRFTGNEVDYPEGTQLKYECEDGYLLQGSYSLECQYTGYWSSEAPTCVGECGRSFALTLRKLILNQKTAVGDWPWVVGIAVQENNNRTKVICGGALLNSHTVLTAAHCLTTASRFTLYFGKYYLQDRNDDTQVSVGQSTRIIIHPEFDEFRLDSDIALIKFEPRVRFSVRIQPICLPTRESTAKNLQTGKIGYVAGWGLTKEHLPSDELIVSRLPFQSNEACAESYRRRNITLTITRNMFCAGHPNVERTACVGDSGSPLVFYDSRSMTYTVEGIVSFGLGNSCFTPETQTVFTKVFQFSPWIFRNMQ